MTDKLSAIRILPMSINEFAGLAYDEVQKQYFLSELPSREGGYYYYRKKGLDAKSGTIVLFQYDSKIIASATYIGREHFDQPIKDYHGVLYFDINSIKIFDPIEAAQMREIWPEEFNKFCNVMTQLNAEFYPKFKLKLTGIRTPALSLCGVNMSFEDAVQEARKRSSKERKLRIKNSSPAPERIMVSTTVFKRNPDVVAEVLYRANGFCEECKCPAPFFRRSNNTPYLEVHHKLRLADGGDDSLENTIALCPNCHRRMHYA